MALQPDKLAREIETAVAPGVTAVGLVVESVSVIPAGRRSVVMVVVDLPDDAIGSASLDDVAAASHAVSETMDEADFFGDDPYVLEVTTPGVDRPLTQRRHWNRARTRLVTVTLVGGDQVNGELNRVTDDGIVVVAGTAEHVVAWDMIDKGRMDVDFRKTAKHEGEDD